MNDVTDDDAIAIVQAAIDDYGGIENVTVHDLDVPEYCDYCDHVLTKDD